MGAPAMSGAGVIEPLSAVAASALARAPCPTAARAARAAARLTAAGGAARAARAAARAAGRTAGGAACAAARADGAAAARAAGAAAAPVRPPPLPPLPEPPAPVVPPPSGAGPQPTLTTRKNRASQSCPIETRVHHHRCVGGIGTVSMFLQSFWFTQHA